MTDNSRSADVCLNLSFKFHLDRICSFRAIALLILCRFGLNLLIHCLPRMRNIKVKSTSDGETNHIFGFTEVETRSFTNKGRSLLEPPILKPFRAENLFRQSLLQKASFS